MKEFRRQKNKKRTSEDFIKARKRHLLIQNNRDQLKLLREGNIQEATLFILESSSRERGNRFSGWWDDQAKLYKVTAIPMPPHDPYVSLTGLDAVFYSHGGKQDRLAIGTFCGENERLIGIKRSWRVNHYSISFNVKDEDCLALVKEKILVKDLLR